jgi:serine/threonine protein phosphatase 1
MRKMIVFGDIHGCYPAAQRAVELAKSIGAQGVFLGDYVDRGPSGIKVLQILINAKLENPDWIFLRGNHEQMLLDLIEGGKKPHDTGFVFGGSFSYAQCKFTLMEYKALSKEEQRKILDFLHKTILYHETDTMVFVHGILMDNGLQLDEKPLDELIWSYGYDGKLWSRKPFIHGHLPVDEIVVLGKSININTSCGYGGYLSGLVIDDGCKISQAYRISEDGETINSPASGLGIFR